MLQNTDDALLAMRMAKMERELAEKLRSEIPYGTLIEGSPNFEKWRVAEGAALRASRLEGLAMEFGRAVSNQTA